MHSMVDIGPPIPAGPRHRRQRGRGTRSFVRRTRTNLRKCGVRTPRKTMRRNASQMVLAANSSDCRVRSRPRHEVEKFDLTHSRQKPPTNRCRYGGDMMIEDVKRHSRDGRQVEDTSLQSGVAPVGGTLVNSQFDCGSREHVHLSFSRRRLCQSSSVACRPKASGLVELDGSVVTVRSFFDRVLPFRGEHGEAKRRKIPNVFLDTWSFLTRPC